jgi:hypothetical protein
MWCLKHVISDNSGLTNHLLVCPFSPYTNDDDNNSIEDNSIEDNSIDDNMNNGNASSNDDDETDDGSIRSEYSNGTGGSMDWEADHPDEDWVDWREETEITSGPMKYSFPVYCPLKAMDSFALVLNKVAMKNGFTDAAYGQTVKLINDIIQHISPGITS